MAKYRVADQARDDLDEIWRYTAVEWSVDQAELFTQQFHDRFQSLAEQPRGGRSRPDLGSDLRSVPLLSFVIVYRPTDYGIEIVHIVHGHRRLESLFRQRTNL